jgi:ATP-dependent helicase HepA
VFAEPLGALDRELGAIAAAIREAAAEPGGTLDVDALARAARTALERVHASAFHHLHPERYRPEQAARILSRVPDDLEDRTRSVVLEACRQYGFAMEDKGGRARWYLEFGPEASVETLHGVAVGQRWLGTFDREEGCAHETLDFFASGHPLVEAVLAEIADGARGQVALLELEGVDAGTSEENAGIAAFAREGDALVVRAWDLEGRERAEWAARLNRFGRGVRSVAPGLWNVPRWNERVTALWDLLQKRGIGGNPAALVGVRTAAAAAPASRDPAA